MMEPSNRSCIFDERKLIRMMSMYYAKIMFTDRRKTLLLLDVVLRQVPGVLRSPVKRNCSAKANNGHLDNTFQKGNIKGQTTCPLIARKIILRTILRKTLYLRPRERERKSQQFRSRSKRIPIEQTHAGLGLAVTFCVRQLKSRCRKTAGGWESNRTRNGATVWL